MAEAHQVGSPGRAAQPGTSACRSGTGREGARPARRRSRAGASTGACTAVGAERADRASPAQQARRAHRPDRPRSGAWGSGRNLGSVRRPHLELPRSGAANHTDAAQPAGESSSPRRGRCAPRQESEAACLPRAGRSEGAARRDPPPGEGSAPARLADALSPPDGLEPAPVALPARVDRHRGEVRLVARRRRPPHPCPRGSPDRVAVGNRSSQRVGRAQRSHRGRGEGGVRLPGLA